MQYDMVAIDLDDTLLNSAGVIPERARLAVRAAVEAGVRVVLCTGRTIKGMRRFHEALELDTLMITSGGAEVYDPSGHAIFAYPVEQKTVHEVLSLARRHGVHAQVYIDGELAYQKRNAYAEKYERSYGFPGIEIPDLYERQDIVTPKVLLIAEADRILAAQSEAEVQFPQLAIKRSKPEYLEFVHPDVSKGEAMKFVAAYYGIDLQRVIAVGDNQIDLSMIEAAGLGVAMANADAETKAAADYICASNNDAGVADVIEKMLLEEDFHEDTHQN